MKNTRKHYHITLILHTQNRWLCLMFSYRTAVRFHFQHDSLFWKWHVLQDCHWSPFSLLFHLLPIFPIWYYPYFWTSFFKFSRLVELAGECSLDSTQKWLLTTHWPQHIMQSMFKLFLFQLMRTSVSTYIYSTSYQIGYMNIYMPHRNIKFQ